jgi:hypothetical protein
MAGEGWGVPSLVLPSGVHERSLARPISGERRARHPRPPASVGPRRTHAGLIPRVGAARSTTRELVQSTRDQRPSLRTDRKDPSGGKRRRAVAVAVGPALVVGAGVRGSKVAGKLGLDPSSPIYRGTMFPCRPRGASTFIRSSTVGATSMSCSPSTCRPPWLRRGSHRTKTPSWSWLASSGPVSFSKV